MKEKLYLKKTLLWIFCFLMPMALMAQDPIVNDGEKTIFPYGDPESFHYDFVNTVSGTITIDGTLIVLANYTDNRVTTFTAGTSTGTVYFEGTTGQTISGTGTTDFYNAIFDNANHINLWKDISVTNLATYTNGIIYGDNADPTKQGVFIFNNGATYTGVADTRHVDGRVRKIGNEAFTFPVGDNGFYRFAAISAPTSTTDAFTAQYFNADGTTVYGTATDDFVKDINTAEYWVIERTAGTSSPTVTLSWDTGKTSANIPADLSQLVITRWDGTKWVNEGQIATTGNATSGTITANVTGYGPFTFGIKGCTQINLWVYLEGALTNPATNEVVSPPMRTTLNTAKLLPGQLYVDAFTGNRYILPLGSANQAYNILPWNYSGSEGAEYDSNNDPNNADANYSSTVVDWVLVSFRISPENGSEFLFRSAALLHNDGHIEFPQTTCIDLDPNQEYYVVIEHRNHLLVMSNQSIKTTDNQFTYDFRDKESYINDPFSSGNFIGQKELTAGVYAMLAGNGEQNLLQNSSTDIEKNDFAQWKLDTGLTGVYKIVDYNMDGDITASDYYLFQKNFNKTTSIPYSN